MIETRKQRIVNPREHNNRCRLEHMNQNIGKLFMWVPPREKRIGSWTTLSPSVKSSEPLTAWPRKSVGPNSIHSLPFSNCIALLLFFFLSHLLPRAYAKEEIQGIGVDVLFPINSASHYSKPEERNLLFLQSKRLLLLTFLRFGIPMLFLWVSSDPNGA